MQTVASTEPTSESIVKSNSTDDPFGMGGNRQTKWLTIVTDWCCIRYRPGAPGWEVVILVRKSLLVLLTKLRSQSPYMQGVWSLVVYAFVIVIQARVSPFRQLRHTNMANYFVSVNALAVFSSLIFTSNIPTKNQQATLLHVNLVCMIGGWCYACCKFVLRSILRLTSS